MVSVNQPLLCNLLRWYQNRMWARINLCEPISAQILSIPYYMCDKDWLQMYPWHKPSWFYPERPCTVITKLSLWWLIGELWTCLPQSTEGRETSEDHLECFPSCCKNGLHVPRNILPDSNSPKLFSTYMRTQKNFNIALMINASKEIL